MSQDRRYFDYSVVQYVHERREERLNVGVVVYDHVDPRIVTRISAEKATARIKGIYPEVDRMGLQLYLNDLARALPRDDRVKALTREGINPLDMLEEEWTHMFRFTPARSIPATSVASAVDALINLFLDERPRTQPERAYGAVERGKARTREAIQRVLNLQPGQLGYSDFHAILEMPVGNRTVKFPLDFPFLLFEDYAVDTVSLETQGPKDALRQAEYFIRKIDHLRRYDQHMQPHATVVPDAQRMETSLDLLAYMRDATGLSTSEICLVEDAEVVVGEIKQKRELQAA